MHAAEAAAREREDRPSTAPPKRHREWEDDASSMSSQKKPANEESRSRLEDPSSRRASPPDRMDRIPNSPYRSPSEVRRAEDQRRATDNYHPSEAAHHPPALGPPQVKPQPQPSPRIGANEERREQHTPAPPAQQLPLLLNPNLNLLPKLRHLFSLNHHRSRSLSSPIWSPPLVRWRWTRIMMTVVMKTRGPSSLKARETAPRRATVSTTIDDTFSYIVVIACGLSRTWDYKVKLLCKSNFRIHMFNSFVNDLMCLTKYLQSPKNIERQSRLMSESCTISASMCGK
ncbi:unnamed protein product [Aureobasidium pullulans]|nr:unnamed protein product [Aureobasidium pullulans]